MRNFSIIVAVDEKWGIGRDGKLPWHNQTEMQLFKKITTDSPEDKQNAIIMGRRTWESISAKPLKSRFNIVVSQATDLGDCVVVKSLDEALLKCLDAKIHNVFVIGGAGLYKEAFKHDALSQVYLSVIRGEYDCDVFLTGFNENSFNLIRKEEHDNFFNSLYRAKNIDECQYLLLIKHILNTGRKKMDRTGTGTLSVFGHMMKFNLENNTIPILTTKRVFVRGVIEELLWFLRGSTDNRELKERGVHIWDRDCSAEMLQRRGLDLQEDDIGCGYGYQWRHFGAEYVDCHTDYTGKGFDQIEWLINEIRTNPTSRRLILTAWNPPHISQMCLPPCHYSAQFEVHEGKLSCMLVQRSCDVGLGVPFNITSYAVLTHLLAHQCGLVASKLVHIMGDAHIYLNHIDALRTQLERTPYTFPKLSINTNREKIEDYQYNDFTIYDYVCHPSIKMEMSA